MTSQQKPTQVLRRFQGGELRFAKVKTTLVAFLAATAVIFGLPATPIHLRENFIKDSDGMIFGNALFERIGKEHELLSRHRSILPVIVFWLSSAHHEYFPAVSAVTSGTNYPEPPLQCYPKPCKIMDTENQQTARPAGD